MDILREIEEFKAQLSYSKNIGFFFGAGTSCAIGIPNISQLTQLVKDNLMKEIKNKYSIIENDLVENNNNPITIETILNQVRKIRELTKDNSQKEYLCVSGSDAKTLDLEICKGIYNVLIEKGNGQTICGLKCY